MRVIRNSALFVSVFLLTTVSAVAQYWPKPAATPGVDVVCTGCLELHNGKLTPGYPSTIQTFTGRFLDSQATQDYQQPFKTARAESVVVVPSLHRIYMQIGSALFAYNLDTFFTRLANEELMSVNSIPTTSRYGPHPAPVDRVLSYDEFFYAENEPENGWDAPISDGQRRLQGFDYDDLGYVYLAYSAFGWGIVKDDFASGHTLMHSVHQNFNAYSDDVVPFGVAVFKTSAGRYYVVVMSGDRPNNLFEVTDRGNPVHLPSFNKNIVAFAKNAAMDRIALASGADIQIYSGDALSTGGQPLTRFNGIGSAPVNGITSDGTNFYATSDTQNGLVISMFSPSGGTYSRVDYQLGGGYGQTTKLSYSDGYLVWAGTVGASTLRIFKLQNGVPVEINLSTGSVSPSNYFQRYYMSNPDVRYTRPNFTTFFGSSSAGNTCTITKKNNHTYLIVTAFGLGDVYELPNADGIVVNNLGVSGTANGKIPAGTNSGGPFFGDPVGFKAITGATSPMNVTWDFGDGATASGTTGTQINHQFAGTTSATSLTRTVRATNATDSSITSSVSVTVQKPAPRFGISDKFLFVQPNASSPAPIVVGDNFYDASDGTVESHTNTWVLDLGAPVQTTPPGAVPVGACGSHSLAFAANYGPGTAVPLTITPFNYTVRPFAAAIEIASSNSQNVTFGSLSRASSDTSVMPSTTVGYAWDLRDSSNNLVYGPQSGTASALAIPQFVVPKTSFSGRQGLKAHLVLSAPSGVGAACAGMTTSEAFTNPLSTPDFVIGGSCTNGGPPCTFTVASTNVDPVADGWTYSWSVSPTTASPVTGTGSTFSPSFTAVNTYTISLTATNAVGSMTKTKNEVVTTAGSTCSPIVPGLSIFVGYNQVSGCTQISGTCTAGSPISFLTGTYNYSLSCGTHTYSWNFGDGSALSTAQTPSHTYGNGTYTVTLVVTPPSGIPVTSTATVTVGGGTQPPPPPPPPPTGSCNSIIPGTSIFIGYNQASSSCTQIGGSCNSGSPINFSAGTYLYNFSCGSHTFTWIFGDGQTSTAQNPAHTYANNGTYSVILNVGTPSAGNVQSTATVVVGTGGPPPPPPPPPPTGSCNSIIPGTSIFIGYNQATSSCTQIGGSCNAGSPIGFTAGTYNYSFACGTHTFSWNFGDGSALSTAQNPSHTYANNGAYNVTLNVGTPSAGNVQSTATVVVGTVGQPPPPPPSGNCAAVIPGVTFFVTFNGPASGCNYLSGECSSDETVSFEAKSYNYDFS